MLKYGLVLLWASYVLADYRGIVVIKGPKVSGNVTFTTTEEGVLIEGTITGLAPGKHGFHVHEKGDLSNGCLSTGGHLNPFQKSHGAPDAQERHVGDLGNIEANDDGIAIINFTDNQITLCNGPTGIIGRAVVVHEKEDDLGLGGHKDSLTTGNAGGRVGCGVIGILSGDKCKSGASIMTLSHLLMMVLSILALKV